MNTASIAYRGAPVLGALALVLLSFPTRAEAHEDNLSYIFLDVTENSMGGRLEVPIPDLRTVVGLDLDGSDAEIEAEANAELTTISDYFDDHFAFEANGKDLDVTYTEAKMFFSEADEVDDNYMVLPFTVDVETPIPRNFDLTADLFAANIDGRQSWLILSNDWQTGVIDNGYDRLTVFSEGDKTQPVDLGDPNQFQNFTSSIKLGVQHIQTGPDHILFVLVLLLPSVLVFTKSWEPTKSFGSALWRILKIATMFTVAHSITFTLAGLEIIPLPSPRIVESIIALSIAAAAVHNIRPVVANREWLISFVFGLFHGLGFASLISGLDIEKSTQLVSLLGRNVGIEIGQSIVILLLFPALFLLRRTTYYQKFFVGFSIVLALLSIGWMIERSAEVDLGMNKIVDPIFAWPRVLLLVGVLSVIAAAVWYREKKSDALIPLDVDDSSSAPKTVSI